MPKFCKDEQEVKRCEEVIRKHYGGLKHIFVTLISTDDFPNIGFNTFSRFCDRAKIADRVKLTQSVLDGMFIAANWEEKGADENDDNPDRALCRFEFMEIIVRIADFKYKKKLGITLSEAVEMLI